MIVCPLCDTSIPWAPGADEQLLFEQHMTSGNCIPKPAQKPRCPVKGCREKLTFSKLDSVCQVDLTARKSKNMSNYVKIYENMSL